MKLEWVTTTKGNAGYMEETAMKYRMEPYALVKVQTGVQEVYGMPALVVGWRIETYSKVTKSKSRRSRGRPQFSHADLVARMQRKFVHHVDTADNEPALLAAIAEGKLDAERFLYDPGNLDDLLGRQIRQSLRR